MRLAATALEHCMAKNPLKTTKTKNLKGCTLAMKSWKSLTRTARHNSRQLP
jgi:hypothetical protein